MSLVGLTLASLAVGAPPDQRPTVGVGNATCADPPAIVSAFDTSMLTVVTGAAQSPDGNHLYQYYNGARRTHGDTTTAAGEGMAIGALRMRLDGFVSAEAPYIFNIPTSELPQFTTVPVRVPSCRGSEQPALALNFESSVPTPRNFYVNLPPLFLGHFSPIFARFFAVFSPFAPSFPQDSGNGRQDPEKRSETVEKRRNKNPKLT